MIQNSARDRRQFRFQATYILIDTRPNLLLNFAELALSTLLKNRDNEAHKAYEVFAIIFVDALANH